MSDHSTNDKFVFRQYDVIGFPAAEHDQRFLQDCFVDTGDVEILRDCRNPRRLVLGRTGAGKTALLNRLEEVEDRVIRIKPESLALSYISNSTILQFVSQLGVKLDIFFRLLWRHIFTVEILRGHFHITNDANQPSLLTRLSGIFKNSEHSQALKYLEEWGQSFWEERDFRVKEVTTKFETDLKTSIGTKFDPFNIGSEGLQRLSDEEKAEVIHRAQTVVNQVQIRQLSQIMDMLDECLNDPQKKYFIVIDKLDEDWIEDKLKYLLVRALIETANDFMKVRQAKVIIALRIDLIERVYRLTRDSGFQEEKYDALNLPLSWTKQRLEQVLNLRVDFLVKSRYTKQPVSYTDVLPKRIGGKLTLDYMIERTMMRPRDIIQFFNICINQATNNAVITSTMFHSAEGEYSRDRLRSLADEWYADYPNLLTFVNLLKNRSAYFILDAITLEECNDFCLEQVIGGFEREDAFSETAKLVVDCVVTAEHFRRVCVQIFYKIGLIGLKLSKHDSTVWSVDGRRSISEAEINSETKIAIHPFAFRTLGIVFNDSERSIKARRLSNR